MRPRDWSPRSEDDPLTATLTSPRPGAPAHTDKVLVNYEFREGLAIITLNDPPAHTRVRRAVQRWCTPRAIAQMSAMIDTVETS